MFELLRRVSGAFGNPVDFVFQWSVLVFGEESASLNQLAQAASIGFISGFEKLSLFCLRVEGNSGTSRDDAQSVGVPVIRSNRFRKCLLLELLVAEAVLRESPVGADSESKFVSLFCVLSTGLDCICWCIAKSIVANDDYLHCCADAVGRKR